MFSRKARTRLLALLGALLAAGIAAGVAAGGTVTIFLGTHTGYAVKHTWTVSKSVTPHSVTLGLNQSTTVQYTVTVTETDVQSGWHIFDGPIFSNVSGNVTNVTVVADPGLTGTLSCPSFPISTDFSCTYDIPVPDGSTRNVTATAYFDDATSVSQIAVADFSKTAPSDITYSGPACVIVNDTYSGGPQNQQVCGSQTFTYTRTIGPYHTCGKFTVNNTATIADPSGINLGHSSAAVTVKVTC
jgi:hypothetical protein